MYGEARRTAQGSSGGGGFFFAYVSRLVEREESDKFRGTADTTTSMVPEVEQQAVKERGDRTAVRRIYTRFDGRRKGTTWLRKRAASVYRNKGNGRCG